MLQKFVDAIRYHLFKELESTDEGTRKLFDAILAGDRDRIQETISNGASTQLLDKDGSITPLATAILTMAVESSNAQILKDLLGGNAKLTSKNDGIDRTPKPATFHQERHSLELTKEYQIANHTLIVPIDHPVDLYQSTCYLYDIALGYIAQTVFKKYPDACAIDIGANIGYTTALIQQYQNVPTLCIEGNPNFIEYLTHNATIIGNIEIEQCFVGRDGSVVNFDNINTQRGTASIVNAIDPSGGSSSELNSLQTILNKHPRFYKSKLLKIDTDGSDFSIIITSIDIISKLKPVVYFEYDISFDSTGKTDGFNAIAALIDCGYQRFIIYDNYGNYLLSLSNLDSEKIVDLNAYLSSNHHHSGKIAVHYLDICAFAEEDLDLFDQIRQIEISRSSP